MIDWAKQRQLFSKVLSRDEIYLANHSLGRPLDRMSEDVAGALELWYRDMDSAWGEWLAEMERWRGNLGQLLGVSGNLIVPKSSAGQGLRAVLNSFPMDRPIRVLTTKSEFDSVDFILKTYQEMGRAEVRWVEASDSEGPVEKYSAEDLINQLDSKIDLVVVSKVFFNTGQVLVGVDRICSGAHDAGAAVLLDVYHAAGVIPLDLMAERVDFAVGGSYKYLRGGPGACFLYIAESQVGRRTLDTGWFAKRDRFGYSRSDRPDVSEGGDGWLESTPPILMPYQARSGLEVTLELGVEQLRAQNLAAQSEMRQTFGRAGIDIFQPENPTGFGAFSLLHTADPAGLCKKLKDKGVNTDSRGNFVRFGPDFLNTAEEFGSAAKAISQLS